MAVLKLLNLLAISCLAVIASYGPAPVAAVSISNPHARSSLHHAVMKRKRAATSKRCKPRPSTAVPATTSSSAKPAPTKPAPAKSSSGSGGNSGNCGNNGGNSGGGSGGGKVGIAWPEGNRYAIKNFKTPKVSKYYTWSPYCVNNDDGLECCPMLWGRKQISDFTKQVKPGYAKCVLGPNEPNQSGQADMSPGDAASLWRQYINPLKNQGYMTVSPATTSAPSGKQWMKDFIRTCPDCHMDAVALHWYGTDAQAFIKYVEDFHNTFNMPIWVTEFACQDFSGQNKQASKDQVFNFMRTVTEWMDGTSYVQQYFAFGAMRDMNNVNIFNQLMGSNGLPNALGELYIGN